MKTCRDNQIVCNFGVGRKNIITREKSLVDNYLMNEVTDMDGETMIQFTDPIYLLFHAEKLQQLGASATQWLDSISNVKKSPLAELRSKCDDKDLATMIKSRYLQAPCEIMSWAKQMNENMETFNSEVQKIMQERVAAEQAAAETSQTDKSAE